MATTCTTCTHLDTMTAQERADAGEPTRWWHCTRCNRHLNRYRGMGDTSCRCGANYNAFGQRLRDNWQDNPAWAEDEIDDLQGFELAALRRENAVG